MAPYRHFVGIEALLAAVATHGFRLFAERLRQAGASERDPYKALIELGAAYVAFACEEPAMFKLMFGAARPQGDPALAQAAKDAYGLLVSRVQSFAPKQEWPDRILASWSLVHGLAMLIVDGHVSPGGDPAAMARRIGRLIARPR
jgi:AcrR family transcriptional regulator